MEYNLPSDQPADETLNQGRRMTLVKGFWQNVLAGLKVALFRNVSLKEFQISADQLLAFAVLGLFLSIATNLAYTGRDGFINYYELPRAVFYLHLLLLSGYLVSKLEANQAMILTVPVIFLAASLIMAIIANVLYLSSTYEWISLYTYKTYYAAFAWWLSAPYVATLRICRPARHKILIGAVYLVVIGLPLIFIPKGELWTKSYDPERDEKDYYAAVREDVFYAQPELLEHSLSALKSGRKGVADLYFVGFAGYYAEDVFMKEINSITKLFAERFDTAGRSAVLINNAKTVKDIPIATWTGLTKVLRHIGTIMNPEDDILFLYITSHGSSDHTLSVDFWPLELKEIDPAGLKQVIAESGIKWRVLVISACYSGGFIEPLKDDMSLIITASDEGHNSFGCDNESDFTYFGKAFFDEGLRKTYSFTGAFEKAKQSITNRETSENKTHSNPQIYIGRAMSEKLKSLEARLQHSKER